MDISKHKQFLLSEIKINNPNKLDQVIEDFAYEREIQGAEFMEFDQDKLYDLIEKYPNYFKIGNTQIDDIVQLFNDYFYDYFDYDDLDEWRNPTLRKILEVINKIK